MAKTPVVTLADDAGYPLYPAVTATVASAAGTQVIKAAPGRLCRVVVTVSGTGTVTFYDNPTTASGTVLFAVPASAPVGSFYDVQMPATSGITASAAVSSSAVTVSFS